MLKNEAIGKMRHVVLLKFKPAATPEDIQEVEEGFCALPSKISSILDFEWGTDLSPESRAQGYTHCFIVTYADDAGRDNYLVHPEHEAFKDVLLPRVENVLVLDYIAGV